MSSSDDGEIIIPADEFMREFEKQKRRLEARIDADLLMRFGAWPGVEHEWIEDEIIPEVRWRRWLARVYWWVGEKLGIVPTTIHLPPGKTEWLNDEIRPRDSEVRPPGLED